MKTKTKKAIGVAAGLLIVAIGIALLVLCIMNNLPWWATVAVGVAVAVLLYGGAELADKWLRN